MKNVVKNLIGVGFMGLVALGMSCDTKSGVYMISLENSNITFTDQGGEKVVKLYFTNDWNVSLEKDSWLNVEPNSGKAKTPNQLDSTYVKFIAPANTDTKDRSTKVMFSSENASQTTTVKQSGLDAQ